MDLASAFSNKRKLFNHPRINLPEEHPDVNQVCPKPLSRSAQILDFASRVDYGLLKPTSTLSKMAMSFGFEKRKIIRRLHDYQVSRIQSKV